MDFCVCFIRQKPGKEEKNEIIGGNKMVFEAIQELIADKMEMDAEEITMDSTFKDLGIDSLDMVEMVMELEDKLDKEIELADKIETVGELVKYIEEKC